MSSEKNEEIESYPTSSTIPFPFQHGPYPQQAALMDTMLRSLQLIDEQPRKDETQLRNVIMLESPTGTGKSLSLACASLAWLRFREKLDLMDITMQTATCSTEDNDCNNGSCKVGTTGNDKSGNDGALDWLDAWAPPEELARDELLKKKREECHNRATISRNALNSELNLIRQKIRKIAGTTGREVKGSNMKRVRTNLARNGVNAAKIIERRSKRKLGSKTRKSGDHPSAKAAQKSQMDEDFCVEDYNSNDEGAIGSDYSSSDNESDQEKENLKSSQRKENISKEPNSARELLDGGQLDGSGLSREMANSLRYENQSSKASPSTATDSYDVPTIGNVIPGSGIRKIVYAARTHSQLSQFVGEVRRTMNGDSVRIVALGGRKLLCGNKEVLGPNNSRSEKMVTERCLDLQKGTSSSTSSSLESKSTSSLDGALKEVSTKPGKRKRTESDRKKEKKSCPLLSSKEATSTLALHMLAQPSDIEDLGGFSEATNTCAYYASRESLTGAEVVVVPYNTLLSTQARHAVGLSLKQSLVVIDEAHNIPEALRSISSARLTLPVIEGATSQLSNYVQKYASRLAGKNLFYLGQIRRFLIATIKFLRNSKPSSRKDQSSMVVTATELLFTLKLDNLNVFSLLRYLQKSRLAQKLHGFNSHYLEENQKREEDDNEELFISKHVSSMSIVQEFLGLLNGKQKNGRVVIEWPGIDIVKDSRQTNQATPALRYLLLNPSEQFQDVIEESHAVVLAGGTIRPFSHIATELLGDDTTIIQKALDAEEACISKKNDDTPFAAISASTTFFSCGHVIPPSNVFTTCLSYGPKGTKLDFRHQSRTLDRVCDDLGRSILNVCSLVPAGLVVFLPSYSYEAYLMNHWKKLGLLQLIAKKKKIHREPKSAKDVDKTLNLYSNDACTSNGAILFCVIGGKMSEGINFANDKARCVFIVGLPYPDITDAVLQEKMRLMDKDFHGNNGPISGQAYYNNLCMRAVNQSIGRAIRHAQDYAAIILADYRYSESRIWSGLPQWIRTDADKPKSIPFKDSLSGIRTFFQEMKKN